MTSPTTTFQFDPDFEFSAPHFYDFMLSESAAQVAESESWFETSASHGDSPFSMHSRGADMNPEKCNNVCFFKEDGHRDSAKISLEAQVEGPESIVDDMDTGGNFSTPSEPFGSTQGLLISKHPAIISPSSLPMKRDYTEISKKAPFTDQSTIKSGKICSIRTTQNHNIQAIKKQKLEGGRHKHITSNDEKSSRTTASKLTLPRPFNFRTEKRLNSEKQGDNPLASLHVAGRRLSQFLSIAEKVRRFEMNTRLVLQNQAQPKDYSSLPLQDRPKLKLTTPMEPEFETTQRIRPARVKSTAEMEAEMIAKMPKFKARPLNKKILEAPSLPLSVKSTPSIPEFQEFYLRTSERAAQHSVPTSLAFSSSRDFTMQLARCDSARRGTLGEIGEPCLHTATRTRPSKVKSSQEQELEELAKIPKFKARPLDKKIFWSRGDLGILRNIKRQVTTPVEFRFATEERIHNQSQMPVDLFSKLSLNSHDENQPPTLTKPEPFHLLTQARGQKKEERMLVELKDNQLRVQEQRIPKANPLPFTTDYPEVPQKPVPKEGTVLQPFHLESVKRHEEEILRAADENLRIEKEEIKQRKFHAHPILCNGPVFVPERSRKPLTEVREFALQVDSRAMERAEFDTKVAEKQNIYKRFREEYEAAKKAEEERIVKLMRRTMVPRAVPLPVTEKPFIPKRCSKEPTKPRSPKLSVGRRRERRSSLTLRRQSASAASFSIQKRLQMR